MLVAIISQSSLITCFYLAYPTSGPSIRPFVQQGTTASIALEIRNKYKYKYKHLTRCCLFENEATPTLSGTNPLARNGPVNSIKYFHLNSFSPSLVTENDKSFTIIYIVKNIVLSQTGNGSDLPQKALFVNE